jgi:hypothetical protein
MAEGSERSSATHRPLLGQLMIQHGLIDEVQLAEALKRQQSTFSYLGEILVRMGAITRLQLREMLELQHMLGREAGQSST